MNKKELKKCIKYEKKLNIGNLSFFNIMYLKITGHHSYLRWRYIRQMRYSCYYFDLYKNKSKVFFLNFMFHAWRRNKLGLKLNFEIGGANIQEGLCICHNGPIVIHGKSLIGKNCILHGDNCIGNNGINDDCPILGDNVDIGVGAKIIGNVRLGNNIKIGAGAVVVNSFEEDNITLVGIPARVKR